MGSGIGLCNVHMLNTNNYVIYIQQSKTAKTTKLDRHCTKLLPFRYTISLETRPHMDFAIHQRRQSIPLKRNGLLMMKKKITFLLEDLIPYAITPSMLQSKTNKDS